MSPYMSAMLGFTLPCSTILLILTTLLVASTSEFKVDGEKNTRIKAVSIIVGVAAWDAAAAAAWLCYNGDKAHGNDGSDTNQILNLSYHVAIVAVIVIVIVSVIVIMME